MCRSTARDSMRRSARSPLRSALRGVVVAALVIAGAATGRAQEQTFRIRLENKSGGTSFPGPFAPGVWAVHSAPGVLFVPGEPDGGMGLESLAEDGGVSAVASALGDNPDVESSGAFVMPVGSDAAGPLFPGEAYEFTVTATPDAPWLSFATMLVRTNDIFAAPGPDGIRLFSETGEAVQGDVTSSLSFWDAGTELNEAPGMGPDQAPLQSAPDTGPREGVVSLFSNTTRGLPLAPAIASLTVEMADGNLTLRLENVSASQGAIVTPIAPLFWATHDESWSLFDAGGSASAGLEMLAEDGGPGGLVAEADGAAGVGEAGASAVTLERPEADPGPAMPGETFAASIPLDPDHPRLSIAAMVVESNDAFLAFGPDGLALFDSAGMPRPADAIAEDIARDLGVWDAGTEANEVPGVGPNQPLRQSSPNTGPEDPNAEVRLYADSTNDLASENAGGFAMLEVHPLEGSMFEVTLRNTSGGTSYPGLLTPVAWAVHEEGSRFFATGMPAPVGIERLAEDGNASVLGEALGASDAVGASGVANLPDGAEEPGPIEDGGSYTFTVTPDAEHPFLSIASMVVPSNDTFVAFGPEGVRLLDESGEPRSEEMVAADIAALFRAWDAGSERNQAGAAGPDQAPRQAGPDTGADEGSGAVRELEDPVWSYPRLGDVLRVTIEAIELNDGTFVRGDANADGTIDLSDAMSILGYLFLGDAEPACLDALDADDSGRLNVTDAVRLLGFLFRGGPELPSPREECGADATGDSLECEAFGPCSTGV